MLFMDLLCLVRGIMNYSSLFAKKFGHGYIKDDITYITQNMVSAVFASLGLEFMFPGGSLNSLIFLYAVLDVLLQHSESTPRAL